MQVEVIKNKLVVIPTTMTELWAIEKFIGENKEVTLNDVVEVDPNDFLLNESNDS